MWEFNDEDSKVTTFHTDKHTCDARKPFQPLSEIFGNFTCDGNVMTKTAEDPIIDCLKEETLSSKDIYKVVNAGLEKENYIMFMLRKKPNGKLMHTNTAWKL